MSCSWVGPSRNAADTTFSSRRSLGNQSSLAPIWRTSRPFPTISTGWAPSSPSPIPTRGYGRGSPDRHMVVRPGADISAQHSGDEPKIFVRSGLAPVGIGADRFHTGMDLLRQFPVDLLLLDDGFQHVRLARNVDI